MSTYSLNEGSNSDQLVVAIALLEKFGIIDFNGHVSVRLGDGRILINTGASVRSAISSDQLVLVEPDGTFSQDRQRPPAELPLHMAIYRERSDVNAVVHGHPPWSTILSSAGNDYRVVMAQGGLVGDVPIYPSPESVNNPETANRVAATLGSLPAALLRAHGSVVVGADLLEATVRSIYLELNAERQVKVATFGEPYVFSKDEVAAFRRGLAKRGLFEKCWNYYVAKYGLETTAR